MIREFHIGASHTINLGNYESTKIEAHVIVSVPEGEDYDSLTEKAQMSLRRLLEMTYKQQVRQRNNTGSKQT